MPKKSFNTLVWVVVICCITVVFSGCNISKNGDNDGNTGVVSQTPTSQPNNETQLPVSTSPTQTMPPNNEAQTSSTITSTQTTSPTEASTPSAELQISAPITPTQTMSPTEAPTQSIESQTPDSTSTNQTDSLSSVSVTALETGLDNGTEVKLIVSGQELVKLWAVIIDGEALVPDFTSVFGRLKDTSGNESAGFWSLSFVDTNTNIETVVIENSQYSIKIVEGEYSFICNDETIALTVPAQKINGHLLLPLKAIAEAINANVVWDADAQAISFYY